MNELNVNEIEQVNGGFVFVAPLGVKAVSWALGAVATTATGVIVEHYVSKLLG
jgi:hypothetical protein